MFEAPTTPKKEPWVLSRYDGRHSIKLTRETTTRAGMALRSPLYHFYYMPSSFSYFIFAFTPPGAECPRLPLLSVSRFFYVIASSLVLTTGHLPVSSKRCLFVLRNWKFKACEEISRMYYVFFVFVFINWFINTYIALLLNIVY